MVTAVHSGCTGSPALPRWQICKWHREKVSSATRHSLLISPPFKTVEDIQGDGTLHGAEFDLLCKKERSSIAHALQNDLLQGAQAHFWLSDSMNVAWGPDVLQWSLCSHLWTEQGASGRPVTPGVHSQMAVHLPQHDSNAGIKRSVWVVLCR